MTKMKKIAQKLNKSLMKLFIHPFGKVGCNMHSSALDFKGKNNWGRAYIEVIIDAIVSNTMVNNITIDWVYYPLRKRGDMVCP